MVRFWLVFVLVLTGCASNTFEDISPYVNAPKEIFKDVYPAGGGGNDRCTVSHCTCQVLPIRHPSEVSEEIELSRRESFYFSEDSSILSASEENRLNQFLGADDVTTMSLVGYTDGCGTYAHNRQLALDRIGAVKDEITERGTIPTRDIFTQVEASVDHDPTVRRVDVIFHTKNRFTTMIDKVQADVYLVDASGSMWEGWTGWQQVIGVSFRPNSKVYVSMMRGCYNRQRLSAINPQGGTEIWYSYWWVLDQMDQNQTLAIISDFQSTYPLKANESRVISSKARKKNTTVITIRP